jgi:uncharacterized protein (DUF2141 family)
MTRHRLHAFILLAALTTGLAAAGTSHALTLTVEVTDARSTQGSVNAALYASESGWLQTAQAVHTLKVASAGDRTVLVFSGLAPGRYALSTYHDENGNGQLDKNVLGMPTERYGFTGSAATPGAPAFADATVDVQADTTVRVTLR